MRQNKIKQNNSETQFLQSLKIQGCIKKLILKKFNIIFTLFITGLFLLTISSKQSFAFIEINKQSTSEDQIENQKVTIDKIDQSNFSSMAVLQGLDKVNGKSSELRVRIGGQIEFGKIIIKAKKCWRSPPDQRPENKILLQIEEINQDGTKKILFNGWMFSSSPSISGLEHPVYDITAISCQR